MFLLLSGAIMMGCWVIALFFYRFWKQTHDRLFQIFSLAFWLYGVERLLPIVFEIPDKPRTFLYILRFLTTSLILLAIINKNRAIKSN